MIQLEYFNSTMKNCMNVLGEGIVAHELNGLVAVDPRFEQMVRNSVYTKINNNLERIRDEQADRSGYAVAPLWCRAYLHFIGNGVNDTILRLSLGEDWVDIDNKIYQNVEN